MNSLSEIYKKYAKHGDTGAFPSLTMSANESSFSALRNAFSNNPAIKSI